MTIFACWNNFASFANFSENWLTNFSEHLQLVVRLNCRIFAFCENKLDSSAPHTTIIYTLFFWLASVFVLSCIVPSLYCDVYCLYRPWWTLCLLAYAIVVVFQDRLHFYFFLVYAGQLLRFSRTCLIHNL